MIRIQRGVEPAPLASIRKKELGRLRQARKRGAEVEFGDSYNHPSVRAALHDAQHEKCCYCERDIRSKGEPIEHFRPRSRARRGAGFPDHGYWWLAWSWENLLLSCSGCNGTKSDKFPLVPGSSVLAAGKRPDGAEQRLFIDPARPSGPVGAKGAAAEDPIDELQFVQLAGRWRPVARNGSVRGATTIREIGLDEPDLLGKYQRYVEGTIRPLTRAVVAAIATGQQAAVDGSWGELEGRLFSRYAVFQGLAHDVVDHDIPPMVRDRWKVQLKRPPLP